jgi:hypothetical protein
MRASCCRFCYCAAGRTACASVFVSVQLREVLGFEVSSSFPWCVHGHEHLPIWPSQSVVTERCQHSSFHHSSFHHSSFHHASLYVGLALSDRVRAYNTDRCVRVHGALGGRVQCNTAVRALSVCIVVEQRDKPSQHITAHKGVWLSLVPLVVHMCTAALPALVTGVCSAALLVQVS